MLGQDLSFKPQHAFFLKVNSPTARSSLLDAYRTGSSSFVFEFRRLFVAVRHSIRHRLGGFYPRQSFNVNIVQSFNVTVVQFYVQCLNDCIASLTRDSLPTGGEFAQQASTSFRHGGSATRDPAGRDPRVGYRKGTNHHQYYPILMNCTALFLAFERNDPSQNMQHGKRDCPLRVKFSARTMMTWEVALLRWFSYQRLFKRENGVSFENLLSCLNPSQ